MLQIDTAKRFALVFFEQALMSSSAGWRPFHQSPLRTEDIHCAQCDMPRASMTLRTKLIVSLVTTVIITMFVHGYWSIQQDRENLVREMRVGMIGLSRSIQAALRYIYGEEKDVKATQNFIDSLGRSGNIHGIVVYDGSGKRIAVSVSLTDTKEFPNLDPAPVLSMARSFSVVAAPVTT